MDEHTTYSLLTSDPHFFLSSFQIRSESWNGRVGLRRKGLVREGCGGRGGRGGGNGVGGYD